MATTPKNIYTNLLKITTESFAIFEDNCPITNGEVDSTQEIFTKMRVKFGANLSKKHLAIIFTFELINNDKPLLIIEPALHFGVHNESWDLIYDEKKQLIKISRENAAHLLGLCIGTARGMLHSKTEGTKVNGFFIPLIQPMELIKEDVAIYFTDSFPTKKVKAKKTIKK